MAERTQSRESAEQQDPFVIHKRPRDDTDDEEEDTLPSDDTVSDDAAETSESAEHDEESVEREILGRFGYIKRKVITKTLQGNIFVADLAKDGGHGKDRKDGKRKERQVVIKKTSKKLHSEHVTVQDGRRFGIYENILKECIILKHLTENRSGLMYVDVYILFVSSIYMVVHSYY